MSSINTLQEKLIKEKKRGIAVDIDETLSWTVGYWVKELSKRFGNPENLSPQQVIAKYRYTQLVPYWQTPEALQWMEDRRNDDSLQESLPLIEGVDIIIQEVHRMLPIVAYLTTRPDSVILGTKKWLKKHAFPEAEVIARPKAIPLEDANKWKAKVLESLYPEVIGIIDDNENLVKELPATYQGTVFLYDREESPRDDIHVVICKDWQIVLQEVRKVFSL